MDSSIASSCIIVPVNASWDDFFAEPGFPMTDCEQPRDQLRQSLKSAEGRW